MNAERRLKMVVVIAVHRADDADIVHAFTDMGEQVTYVSAALATGFEFPMRRQVPGRLGISGADRLPAVFSEARFGIEGIHMRNTAGHEKENDTFGFPLEVRCLGREWIQGITGFLGNQLRNNPGQQN